MCAFLCFFLHPGSNVVRQGRLEKISRTKEANPYALAKTECPAGSGSG